MTKKDYELIASALYQSKPDNYPSDGAMSYSEGERNGKARQWHRTITVLANDLKRNDYKFDTTKFMKLAGNDN